MTNTSNFISIRELMSKTWMIYKERFLLLIGIIIIPNTISLLIQILIRLYETPPHLFLVLIIVGAILVCLGFWSQAALLLAIKDKEHISILEYYKKTQNKIWPLFVTSVIAVILILLGLVLLVIPGIIVAMWFCFAMYIVLYEDKKYFEALKASKALIKGFIFKVFLRWAAVLILYIIVAVILVFSFSNVGEIGTNVLTTILGTLVAPFIMIYGYLIYNSLKIRNL